ncbi:hypothetical protein Tco_0579470 [Tanacetum coccineum]
MLKDISRDDLTELYRIVMNRYGMNGPEDEFDKIRNLQKGISDEDCYINVGNDGKSKLALDSSPTMSNRHKDWLCPGANALVLEAGGAKVSPVVGAGSSSKYPLTITSHRLCSSFHHIGTFENVIQACLKSLALLSYRLCLPSSLSPATQQHPTKLAFVVFEQTTQPSTIVILSLPCESFAMDYPMLHCNEQGALITYKFSNYQLSTDLSSLYPVAVFASESQVL